MKIVSQIPVPPPGPDGFFTMEIPADAHVIDASLLPLPGQPGQIGLFMFVLGNTDSILINRKFLAIAGGIPITQLGELRHIASPVVQTDQGLLIFHVFEVTRPPLSLGVVT